MPKTLQHITLLFCLIAPFILFAQNDPPTIKTVGYNKFLVGDEVLHYKDMGSLFTSTPEDWKFYNENIESFETSRILGYASLASLATGVFLVANRNGTLRSTVAGIGLLAGTPILAIPALVIHSKARKKRQEWIRDYNISRRKELGELQLVPASQGIGLGLSYTF